MCININRATDKVKGVVQCTLYFVLVKYSVLLSFWPELQAQTNNATILARSKMDCMLYFNIHRQR